MAVFNERLMYLYKTDICMELLVESGIGKTLKYLQDFSRLYESDLPDLKLISQKCEQILQKWKNYVMTTVFDEKKDYQCEFMKYRYLKQAEKKIVKKGPMKSKGSGTKTTTLLAQTSIETCNTSGQSMLYKALMKFEGDDEVNKSQHERSNSMCYNTASGFAEENKNMANRDPHNESNDSMVDLSAENQPLQNTVASSKSLSPNKQTTFQKP